MAGKQVQVREEFVHIYSTLANDQKFVIYANMDEQFNDLPRPVREVLINGKAGLATKNLITPQGVYTKLPAEDWAAIKDHPHVVHFVERKFIKVEAEKVSEIEAVVGDMNANDPSAPLTPADYVDAEAQGIAAPMVPKE